MRTTAVVCRLLALLASALSLASCTTYPPPTIANGRYICPRYELSIAVPEGWVQAEKVPASSRRNKTVVSYAGAHSFGGGYMTEPRDQIAHHLLDNLTFLNEKARGVIAVECSGAFLDAGTIPAQRMEEIVTRWFKK